MAETYGRGHRGRGRPPLRGRGRATDHRSEARQSVQLHEQRGGSRSRRNRREDAVASNSTEIGVPAITIDDDEIDLLQYMTVAHQARCQLEDLKDFLGIEKASAITSKLAGLRRVKIYENRSNVWKSVVFVFMKNLRLCAHYPQRCTNNNCRYVHLCPDLVADVSHDKTRCRLQGANHRVSDLRQAGCMRYCGELPKEWTDDELLSVVRSSNLAVCTSFLDGYCDPKSCIRLHICDSYIRSELCPRSSSESSECSLGHDLTSSSRNKALLFLYEMSHMVEKDPKFLLRMILCRSVLAADSSTETQTNRGTSDVRSRRSRTASRQMTHPTATLTRSCSTRSLRSQSRTRESRTTVSSTRKDCLRYESDDEDYQTKRCLTRSRSTCSRWSDESSDECTTKTNNRRISSPVKSECPAFEEHPCNNGLLKCSQRHTGLTYMWRVKRNGQWTLLEENRLIEKEFCKPDSKTYTSLSFRPTIDFDEMTSSSGEIQRLSTPSYVDCRHQPDSTKWTWYWNCGSDQTEVWLMFKENCPPFQDVLEAKFIDKTTQIVCYEIDGVDYELDFRTMKQTNVNTGYKRNVRRRPTNSDHSNWKISCFHYDPLKLPLNEGWSPMDTETLDFSDLVPVDNGTEVEREFHLTMPLSQFAIHRIYRVQNLHMWQKYQMRKTKIAQQYPAKERSLFHGTPDYETVRCICHQNLDPRMHGKHRTSYGKGSYFSTTAKYSHRYTRETPGKRNRHMFYARVLMGRSVVGKPEYQRPPPVDPGRPHGTLYDTCVDDLAKPTIVVVFDNDQCYPEFLIEYKLLATNDGANSVSHASRSRIASNPVSTSSFYHRTPSRTSNWSPSPTGSRRTPAPILPQLLTNPLPNSSPAAVYVTNHISAPPSLSHRSPSMTGNRPPPPLRMPVLPDQGSLPSVLRNPLPKNLPSVATTTTFGGQTAYSSTSHSNARYPPPAVPSFATTTTVGGQTAYSSISHSNTRYPPDVPSAAPRVSTQSVSKPTATSTSTFGNQSTTKVAKPKDDCSIL